MTNAGPDLCQVCRRSSAASAADGMCQACAPFAAAIAAGSAPGLPRALEPQSQSSVLAAGSRFGRYEIIGRLNHGAMGEIWKVRDTRLERVIALKVIVPEHAADRQFIERFEAEAIAAAKLTHPSAIPIYDKGRVGNTHYFTMSLIEGQSLAELVTTAPLPPDRAARYMRDASEQIASLHTLGTIHRDVKPANILIDGGDCARLTDFGLARRPNPDPWRGSAGRGAGTLSYMAPEQASGGAIDARADVYGVGATLYHLITGRPPFLANTEAEMLRLMQESEPARPRSLIRHIPRQLELICLCCLAKDPSKRYRSAEALTEDLRLFLTGYPIKARPQSRLSDLRFWALREPVLSIFSAALFAAAVLLVVTAIMTRREVLRANRVAASSIASLLELRLTKWSAHLEEGATDATLRTALRDEDTTAATRWLENWCKRGGLPSGTATLLDPSGIVVAHCGVNDHYFGADLRFRDYFRGAIESAGQDRVYLSAVYPSVIDQRLRFALSMAVRADTGQVLGVLAVGCDAGPAIGVVNIQTEDRKVAVLGDLDLNRPPRKPLLNRTVQGVISSYVAPTQVALWTNEQQLDRGLPTLAVVAPIGRTKSMVVVQSPDWTFRWGKAVVIVVVAVLVSVIGRKLWRRRQRMAAQAQPVTHGTRG